jgi:flagellar basal body-associated protein FliL
MTWQKRLFIFIVILMAAGMAIASWDIARKTTFPGSKGQLKERIRKQLSGSDTIQTSSNPAPKTPQKEPK